MRSYTWLAIQLHLDNHSRLVPWTLWYPAPEMLGSLQSDDMTSALKTMHISCALYFILFMVSRIAQLLTEQML